MGMIGCGDLDLTKNEAVVYHWQVRLYSLTAEREGSQYLLTFEP
jgi:hypothetical protein